MTKRFLLSLAVAAFTSIGSTAFAQTPNSPAKTIPAAEVDQLKAQVAQLQNELRAVRDDYGQRLAAIEARIVAIGAGTAVTTASATTPTAPGMRR